MPEKDGEMPKEYVGNAPQEHGSITVGWHRDHCDVSLSVAGPVGWRDPFLRRSGGADEVDPDNGLDWHVSLTNRFEVNQLIRLLRKARDQAFGRDE